MSRTVEERRAVQADQIAGQGPQDLFEPRDLPLFGLSAQFLVLLGYPE
jgi:hypothetical protein